MKRKESFINDKRRVSYLASAYYRINHGKSLLIEGGYGAGKTRFLQLIKPKRLRGVWVESLFTVHEILASILRELDYEANANYRRSPAYLKRYALFPIIFFSSTRPTIWTAAFGRI
jgi:hypothetical protein